jgi:hypothetical protein
MRNFLPVSSGLWLSLPQLLNFILWALGHYKVNIEVSIKSSDMASFLSRSLSTKPHGIKYKVPPIDCDDINICKDCGFYGF